MSSTTDRDRSIIEHLPLVSAIASRIHRSLPFHIDLEDLTQIGAFGLIEALDNYDPSRGIPFAGFAPHRIRGAIMDGLRELDWASRDARRLKKRLAQAMSDLCVELKRTPTSDEVRRKLGCPKNKWEEVRWRAHVSGPMSMSLEGNRARQVESSESRPDVVCEKWEMVEIVAAALGTLPERYQKIVRAYYFEQMTAATIARKFGVNESRICQILKSSREKLELKLVHVL